MRLATIDIGTNTAQLLVVDGEGDGFARVLDGERFVRLGEGVDANGRIGAAARDRLLDTLAEHLAAAASCGADRVVVGATSAMRDAANRASVCRQIQDELDLEVDVLSGDEEATWSFAAACAPFDDLDGEVLVVDIGGGSTELIAGRNPAGARPDYPAAIRGHASLDVGCVRLTERCFDGLPPADTAVDDASAIIDGALAATDLAVSGEATLVGTAGTVTALARVDAGPRSRAEDVFSASDGEDGPPGAVLSAATVRRWRDHVLRRPVDAIFALHPDVMEGRADVFPMGVLLLDRVLAHFGLDACRVSPYELRYGLALRDVYAGRVEGDDDVDGP